MTTTYQSVDEFTLQQTDANQAVSTYTYDSLINRKNQLLQNKADYNDTCNQQISAVDALIEEADALGLKSLTGIIQNNEYVSLSAWALNKSQIISSKGDEYIQQEFSLQNQIVHVKIMMDAIAAGRTDVFDYINQIWVWGAQVIQNYYATKEHILNIASDTTKSNADIYNEIMQVIASFDLKQFDTSKPNVEIMTAMTMLATPKTA